MLQGIVGFLGYGNMGSAILEGLIEAGALTGKHAAVYDPDPDRRLAAEALGATVAAHGQALAGMSDVLILAVKPQTMHEALGDVRKGIKGGALIISIAAGISIAFIRERLKADVRIIRVMPNTPALVNAGAAGIALGPNCTQEDAAVARTIFESIGIAEIVAEKDLDVVTALSGSGPAYFFYMVECLVNAAVNEGLREEQATRLAAQTLMGAGKLLIQSGEAASALRERVTSKGGTTEAALRCLREDRFSDMLGKAVRAAAARSRELGA
ncbi:MAG: pyrroline-5-carboxylate reductase [Candidatus Hydrogenedentes bacterium]|nr:pyrroline-5-carboxylate reductase [Candidatus Hydrogenedentota bacterium]